MPLSYDFDAGWDGRAKVVLTDDAIAMLYATKITTLNYFQLSYGGDLEHDCWWRVTPMEPGQQDIGLGTRMVRRIDAEDGSNASNYFEWEWQAAD
jgi:hypothetical protein